MNFLPLQLRSFTAAHRALWRHFDMAHRVHTERWQGVDIRGNPSARMLELVNTVLHLPQAPASVENLQRDLASAANFPWAEDHFQERVCGSPINPGVEWANWPDGQSADRFRKLSMAHPDIPPHRWAYLAGLIDSQSSLSSSHLKIYRQAPELLHELARNFRVGEWISGNHWSVVDPAELLWLFRGVRPFLTARGVEVEAAISQLEDQKAVGPIWGIDWEPKFETNYMSRYWPRGDNDERYIGLYGQQYGDLNDLVSLLRREPHTRQAYFPQFFPEDTALPADARKPCTLGYQFLRRGDRLHIYYPMRSCDFFRHWGDDCYLTVRLGLWLLEQLEWHDVKIGSFTMHCTSLHMFENDHRRNPYGA